MIGGAISSWLGFDHAKYCKALHINILTMRHALGPQTPEEYRWAEQFDRDQQIEDGYRTVQATRPQTLSYAMNDSPVGIAAWLIESLDHGPIFGTVTLRACIPKTISFFTS